MREIAYKNLTSQKYRRRIISISETAEKKGFLTNTHKRFIYIVKEKAPTDTKEIRPEFYVTKVYNTQKGTERVLFRIKGIMEVQRNEKRLWVYYCHSLKIDITKAKNATIEAQ